MNKLQSKLILAWRTGELNMLTNRKNESIRKLGSTECLTRVCGGEDDLDHVQECFGYEARPSSEGSEQAMADYLYELHKERVRKFKRPLIYIKIVYCLLRL